MPERETNTFLEPDRIVRSFGLEAGDHVADFGAGHGYFTIPMARLVGGDGKVYTIDIQKSVLDIIRARAKVEHLLNIEPVWADLDEPGGSKLKDKFLDFVVIANILFQAEKKRKSFPGSLPHPSARRTPGPDRMERKSRAHGPSYEFACEKRGGQKSCPDFGFGIC